MRAGWRAPHTTPSLPRHRSSVSRLANRWFLNGMGAFRISVIWVTHPLPGGDEYRPNPIDDHVVECNMSADNAGARANHRPAAIRGISRRDVVKGSVATAILSLSASTMMSLRKKNPLYVVLGDDSSGAFRFLLDFWSRRSGVEVVYEPAGSHPPEQRHKMLAWVDRTEDRDYVADLFGLDVVHVPEFIANGHIVKLGRDLIAEANEAYGGDQPLRFDNFVGRTLTTCRSPAVADEGHYAVPLTANVGVLFRNAAV